MNVYLKKQKGSVLILSLVLLVVLTLLAISASQDSIMQERMAGNMRNNYLAFEAAEAALREGEAWVDNLSGKPIASDIAAQGVYLMGSLDPINTVDEQWWIEADNAYWNSSVTNEFAGTLPYGVDSSSNELNLTATPRYVVQESGVVKDSLAVGTTSDALGRQYYQITARGMGIDGRSQVILQSTIARRF